MEKARQVLDHVLSQKKSFEVFISQFMTQNLSQSQLINKLFEYLRTELQEALASIRSLNAHLDGQVRMFKLLRPISRASNDSQIYQQMLKIESNQVRPPSFSSKTLNSTLEPFQSQLKTLKESKDDYHLVDRSISSNRSNDNTETFN